MLWDEFFSCGSQRTKMKTRLNKSALLVSLIITLDVSFEQTSSEVNFFFLTRSSLLSDQICSFSENFTNYMSSLELKVNSTYVLVEHVKL